MANQNESPRRFLAVFAGTLCFLGAAVAALHAAADPYGLLDLSLKGFNDAKPAINRHERVSQALAVQRQCARGLVLGSSRALHGVDPALLGAFDGAPAYNAGLGSPRLESVLDFLRMAQERCPLREVLIGLDFTMFNGHKIDADRDYRLFSGNGQGLLGLPRRASHLSAMLFSADSLRDSLSTLGASRRGEAPLRTSFGQMTDAYYAAKTRRIGGYGASFEYEVAGYASYLAPPRFDFDLDGGLRDFRRLLDYLRQQDLQAQFVVLPLHAYEQAGIAMLGLQGEKERWLRQIAALVEEGAGPAGARPRQLLLNCSLHGRHETESVPVAGAGGEMAWWWESSHFKQEVGALLVAEVAAIASGSKARGELCESLKLAEAEASIARMRQARREWSASHAADLGRVREALRRSLDALPGGRAVMLRDP